MLQTARQNYFNWWRIETVTQSYTYVYESVYYLPTYLTGSQPLHPQQALFSTCLTECVLHFSLNPLQQMYVCSSKHSYAGTKEHIQSDSVIRIATIFGHWQYCAQPRGLYINSP